MNYEERLEWFSKRNELLENEIERLNNIIGKAIGLIYDYQMNDEENVNYKELLYVLKGVDKERVKQQYVIYVGKIYLKNMTRNITQYFLTIIE